MTDWQAADVAVRTLVYNYAELIDSGDFDGIGELFRHATIDTGSGELVGGTDAVRRMYEENTIRYPDTGTPHTRHVTTNLIVDIGADGATATCRSYVVVFQQVDDFPLQPVWSNRYEDRFECVDGTWRFAHRRMTDHMPGNTSRHLYSRP
ncbi:MAG TPA: nuclear transport factor 2 family protein [Acidimicrobiales bacterium]|jgi:hypothetical protein|nr:nuclear transport factor 2 family protein [Acidimicrobiales bacterium]